MIHDLVKGMIAENKRGVPVVVAGVGSGLTARGAAAGGADIIAVYNTAVYRVRGLPSALAFLPYDNANSLTFQTAPEVISAAGNVPVILGIGVHDPRASLEVLLDKVQAIGGIGVTNEPFIGMYGKDLQFQLEYAGLGFSREVELIKLAVDRGMLTLGWVFSTQEARRMAEIGADIIGVMIGVTAGGVAGGKPVDSINEALEKVSSIARTVHEFNKDIVVLGHGGPLNDTDSISRLIKETEAIGYVTGSTGERIPVEMAVKKAIKKFKQLNKFN